MASTIKLKNGSGAPTSGQLVQGEPALDLTNKRLYTENASGTVIEVGTNPSSLTTASADINGGTIDGTVIGGSSAAAGTFTSITGTSANINGTVTAGGLTVDGGITANLGSAYKVQLNGSYPYVDFIETDTVDVNTRLQNSAGSFLLRTINDADTTAATRLKVDHATGDLSLFEDTGTTAKFFWDASAESLGIGTTSPSYPLDVELGASGAESIIASFNNTSTVGGSGASVLFQSGGVDFAKIGGFRDSSTTGSLRFSTRDAGTITEHMRIDSSGNVGIGTASPSQKVTIYNGTTKASLRVASDLNFAGAYIGTASSDNRGGALELISPVDSTNSNSWRIANEPYSNSGSLLFSSAGNSSSYAGLSYTERARIDSSGNLLVGTTNASQALNTVTANTGIALRANNTLQISRDGGSVAYFNRLTSDGAVAEFLKDGTTVGSISVTGSATAYNTSSDYRLKENVVSMDNASDRVLALNPVRFNFIADPDKTVDGFLAHEAQEVVPEAVHGVKDEVDDEGNPVYQGIDQSKLVPLLTKALQEALTEIADLKARVNALETN